MVVVGALAVSGCTAPRDSDPDPSGVPGASTAPTAPAAAMAIPGGTAADNLVPFTAVMDAVAATPARAQGRAYIDALVGAGFPRPEMEVTADLTTVGDPVDSLQFSVRWEGECLVGQVGPSVPAPTARVMPLLPGGTCLIGQTRPIDW